MLGREAREEIVQVRAEVRDVRAVAHKGEDGPAGIGALPEGPVVPPDGGGGYGGADGVQSVDGRA